MKPLLLFLALLTPSFGAGFLYPTTPPIKLYTDNHGLPLQNGYIYFGLPNQNPEVAPTQMYWDSAGTIPAAQPIRTISGYITRQGTPANVYATGDFSITVKTSAKTLVCYSPTSTDIQLALAIAGASSAAAIPIADAGNYFSTKNVEAALQQLGPLITQMVTALAGTVPTGTMAPYVGTAAPAGWVTGSGLTIGNVASNATERANADTSPLYVLLWNTTNTSVTAYPSIQDSTGTPTSRGVSAANDFAANKRLPLPDMKGRVIAGIDSGTPANRITIAGAGFDGTTYLNAGGSQTHTLTTAELATHNHTLTDPGHNHTQNAHGHGTAILSATSANSTGGAVSFVNTATSGSIASTTATNNSNTTGITLGTAGSGVAHSVTQPTMVATIIIKL